MKTIVLMGNPNVGKSVVFLRLTDTHVIVSNYPGTTVDIFKGILSLAGHEEVEVIDAPGIYSLIPSCKADETAVEILKQADMVVNVIDATTLERNLLLTLELVETGKPLIIVLNMWDETRHRGIEIDVDALEQMLKIPVVPTVALTGEGINNLVNRLGQAGAPRAAAASTEDDKWQAIGHITRTVQHITHRHPSMRDKLAELTIKPLTGLPLGLGIIGLAFVMVRMIGEGLIRAIFNPLFEIYRPVVMAISRSVGPGFLHEFLVGKLIDGNVDYIQSMGILTTALYVPFGMVLPYIAAFYLILAILEDSGYLPRLATLADNMFHRIGMHGHGIIPVFLGLGCNVTGTLSTRILETRKQRFIAATLVAIAVPCMAQSAMIFGVLGSGGTRYIFMVFAVLGIVFVLTGLILNHYVKGESLEIFLEIPPYRRPGIAAVLKKTWMRVRWFLKEAVPYLFLGVFIVNLLYATGIQESAGRFMAPVMEGWFGLPRQASAAFLAGFLRKDLAVGMLVPLGMTPQQLTIAVTILAIYFPCVGTFAVLLKELGVKDLLKSTLIMIVTALLVGGIMRVVLLGI